jgi:hypothetical protein
MTLEEESPVPTMRIQPKGSFQLDQLIDLSADLELALPGYDIGFEDRPEMRGYGVTWWEGVRVMLEGVPADLVAIAIEKCLVAGVGWMRRRFKADYKRYHRYRPKFITVVDGEGNWLGDLTLKSPRHKPIPQALENQRANAPPKKVKKKKQDKKETKKSKKAKKPRRNRKKK